MLSLKQEIDTALDKAKRIELPTPSGMQVWHVWHEAAGNPLVLLHGGSGSLVWGGGCKGGPGGAAHSGFGGAGRESRRDVRRVRAREPQRPRGRGVHAVPARDVFGRIRVRAVRGRALPAPRGRGGPQRVPPVPAAELLADAGQPRVCRVPQRHAAHGGR